MTSLEIVCGMIHNCINEIPGMKQIPWNQMPEKYKHFIETHAKEIIEEVESNHVTEPEDLRMAMK